MKVIYDVHHTGRRYMNTADMLQEIAFLGLNPDCSHADLDAEIHRRGLDNFSMGRVVRGASA